MYRLDLVLLINVIITFACLKLAREKRRNVVLWVILALFFGLIPLLILVFAEPKPYVESDDIYSDEKKKETKKTAAMEPEEMPEITFDIENRKNENLSPEYKRKNTLHIIGNIIIMLGILTIAIIAALLLH